MCWQAYLKISSSGILIVNVLKCYQEVQTTGMTCHAISIREPSANIWYSVVKIKIRCILSLLILSYNQWKRENEKYAHHCIMHSYNCNVLNASSHLIFISIRKGDWLIFIRRGDWLMYILELIKSLGHIKIHLSYIFFIVTERSLKVWIMSQLLDIRTWWQLWG